MLLPIPFNNPYTYSDHSGVDFPRPRGEHFRASGNGVVGLRSSNPRGGNLVWVDYDDLPRGAGVAYAHLDNYIDSPPVGTRVTEGTVLGRVGNSGRSTGPHLHMEVNGHASTAGFWRFFDRNRVVSQGSTAGEEQEPAKAGNEDDTMMMLKIIAGGSTHLAALGEGVFKHFKAGEPIERIVAASGSTWQAIDISELPAFLATYGCDTSIWDFRDANGNSVPFSSPGAQFVVVDPLSGKAQSGNTWTATGVIRASQATAITDSQVKAIADAVAAQIGQSGATIDYGKVADSVRDRFRTDPLK